MSNSTFNQDHLVQPDHDSITNDLSDINDETPPNYVTARDKLPQAVNDLRADFKSFQSAILSTLEGFFMKQEASHSKLLSEFEDIKNQLHL